MSQNEITLGENILDSRDIIKKIEEIEGDIEGMREEAAEFQVEIDAADAAEEITIPIADRIATLRMDVETLGEQIQDLRDELAPWKELADEFGGYGDWDHGEALILESHFKEYAQQLAEDIGAMEDSSRWPGNCIDWDQAADDLKMDYTEATAGGYTYYMRA